MESVADNQEPPAEKPAEVPVVQVEKPLEPSEPSEPLKPLEPLEPLESSQPSQPEIIENQIPANPLVDHSKVQHLPGPPQPLAEEDKRVSTPLQKCEVLNSNRSGPGSPTVFISLKSESRVRSPCNFEIADSLFDRKLQKEAKISKMRVQKKADEIGQLQNVPTINKKSKKIASGQVSLHPVGKDLKEGKNKEKNDSSEDSFLKLIPDSPKSPTQSLKAKIIQEHAVFDNSEVMKNAVKMRDSLPARIAPEPPKKLSLTERGRIIKEKKMKKIREAEEIKKGKELEGCTFKPKTISGKNQVSESGTCIIKRSNSGSMMKNDLSSQTSPRANKAVLEFFENFQLSEPKSYSFLYTQMSPVNCQLKYKHGFNTGAIESKAHPMVDYRVIGHNLLE
jgi:hypothetical protein